MAILCPETRAEDAMVVAERIRQAIAGRTFDLAGGERVRITVSLGIAAMPEHAKDEAGLVDAADRALYEAKARGRNRVRIADIRPANESPTVAGRS